MLKIATSEDTTLIQELMDSLMEDSIYKGMYEGYRELVPTYVSDPTKYLVVLVMEEDKIVGFGAYDFIPHPFYIARQAAIYIKPEFRGKEYTSELRKAFEYWGINIVKAKQLMISVSNKADLSSAGYRPIEVIHMKEVN